MSNLNISGNDDNDWEIIDEISTTNIVQSTGTMNSSSNKSIETKNQTQDTAVDQYMEEYDDDCCDEYNYTDDVSEDPTLNHPIDPSKLGLKFSYRDALLMKKVAVSNRTVIPTPTVGNISEVHLKEWKPTIKIEKVKKPVPQPAHDVFLIDEYDDVGFADLVFAHLDYKSSAANSRYRSITMLTPKQQATKDSRIAVKMTK